MQETVAISPQVGDMHTPERQGRFCVFGPRGAKGWNPPPPLPHGIRKNLEYTRKFLKHSHEPFPMRVSNFKPRTWLKDVAVLSQPSYNPNFSHAQGT